jgi:hypothetical protein
MHRQQEAYREARQARLTTGGFLSRRAVNLAYGSVLRFATALRVTARPIEHNRPTKEAPKHAGPSVQLPPTLPFKPERERPYGRFAVRAWILVPAGTTTPQRTHARA